MALLCYFPMKHGKTTTTATTVVLIFQKKKMWQFFKLDIRQFYHFFFLKHFSFVCLCSAAQLVRKLYVVCQLLEDVNTEKFSQSRSDLQHTARYHGEEVFSETSKGSIAQSIFITIFLPSPDPTPNTNMFYLRQS
ncbi:unnamed protein product [Amoebophrya sp. A120]|nr:unnamed protein product [Amoebophrya sp. A120]|eukprot:GSA120T00009253001.1